MKELYSIMGLTPFRLFKLVLCLCGLMTAIGSTSLGQLIGSGTSSVSQQATESSASPTLPSQDGTTDARQAQQPGAARQPMSFNSDALNLSEQSFDLRRDWWKYSIMLLVLAISGFYIVKAGAALIRLICLVACVAFSTFASFVGGPLLEPFLARNAPYLDLPHCPVRYWAYLVVFLVAYIIASMIVGMLKKPLQPIPAEKKSEKP